MILKTIQAAAIFYSLNIFAQGSLDGKLDHTGDDKVSVGELNIFKTILDPWHSFSFKGDVNYLPAILGNLELRIPQERILGNDIRALRRGGYTPFSTTLSTYNHNLKDVDVRTMEHQIISKNGLRDLFDGSVFSELEKMSVNVASTYYKTLTRPVATWPHGEVYEALVELVVIRFNVEYRSTIEGDVSVKIASVSYSSDVDMQSTDKFGRLIYLVKPAGSRSSAGG